VGDSLVPKSTFHKCELMRAKSTCWHSSSFELEAEICLRKRVKSSPVCLLMPGFIYSMWRWSTKYKPCLACGSSNVTNFESPSGSGTRRTSSSVEVQEKRHPGTSTTLEKHVRSNYALNPVSTFSEFPKPYLNAQSMASRRSVSL
jgi:hypothetical protein